MSKQSPMITDQDWMQALKEMRDQINQRESELAAARETIKTLNRRAQQAEAGVRDNIEACKRAGVSMGRTLANAAADMYLRRAEKAESERDAQHEQVLRLTAERDAVSVVHACPPKGSGVMPCCGATPFEKQGERLTTNPALVTCDRQRLAADLDEARAQVWGRQRGSVVISLMLLGAIAGICTGWLALVGSDFPPPLRPYPVAAGNDPDPPPRRSDWKLQRRCMREYRRTKRPTN